MGVEAGPSGAVAVAGPPPSFEAAPALGSIKAFGPKYESLSFAPIDSPIGKGDLQNMVPYKVGMFDSRGSISFSPVKDEKVGLQPGGGPELSVADAVTEAESILSQVRVASPINKLDTAVTTLTNPVESLSKTSVVEEAKHWLGLVEPKVDPYTKVPTAVNTLVDPVVAVRPHLQPEVRRMTGLASPASLGQTEAVYAPAPIESGPAIQERVVEDIVEERKLMTDPIDGQSIRTDEDEEIFKRKKSYLVDQPVLAQVLSEADQAIDKGEEEVERLGLGKKIIGSIVAKFLPAQHEGNAGGAVKPYGVDGTITARKETIAAKKEFASRKEVEAIVLENRPVTIGENGERASKNEVKTTFRDFIVKPTKLVEIVEKRIVKKRREVSSGSTPVFGFGDQDIKPKAENNLEDLDLAEVFPSKAA